MSTLQAKNHSLIIKILSVAIPVAVALLFMIPPVKGVDLSFLPPIYATINGLTAVLLLAALWAVKNKKVSLHQKLINVCMGLSVSFLLMYVAYHLTSEPTKFGGEGMLKMTYFFFLITHILLSIVVIPFVLFTYSKALLSDFKAHRKLAKISFPLWLYVAVTGVIVYVMIAPYYA